MITRAALLMTVLAVAGAVAAEPVRLRFGSTWAIDSVPFAVLRRAADATEKAGGVVVTTLPGHRWADEAELAAALREGKLEGATLTSEGLAATFPDLCVFEAPGLSPDQRETDRVRDALVKKLEPELAKRGLVLLGWGELGAQYVFSTSPVRTPADFAAARPIASQRTGVLASLFGALASEPLTLATPDVGGNLSSGAAGAVIATPAQVVRLGWFRQLRFVTNVRVSSGAVATLVRRDAYERLSTDERAALSRAVFRGHRELTAHARAGTISALDVLVARGVTVVQPELQPWERLFNQVAEAASRTVYAPDLLAEVRKGLTLRPK